MGVLEMGSRSSLGFANMKGIFLDRFSEVAPIIQALRQFGSKVLSKLSDMSAPIGKNDWVLAAQGACLSSVGVIIERPWARSSAGEHYVDIVGVAGSIPAAPTTIYPILILLTATGNRFCSLYNRPQVPRRMGKSYGILFNFSASST